MKKEIFIKPHNLTHSNLKAFFTTKSLNGNLKDLLKSIDMSEEDVYPVRKKVSSFRLSNKKHIAKEGFKAPTEFSNRVYLPIQKHTDRVMVLEDDFKPVVADAVITRGKGVLIGIHVADCVPILLYDKKKSAVGAVHAGWRGTAAHILKNTIKTMQEEFYSSTEDILIAIGPSIRQCCYGVDEEVKDAVYRITGEGNYYQRQNGKYFIDLSSANRIQALSMGIQEENIWQSAECTFCNPDRFYSYRYTKGCAGRQSGFIGIF